MPGIVSLRFFPPARVCLCALLVAASASSAWARGGAAEPPAPTARVPSVSGLTLPAALRRLKSAGFEMGTIEEYTPEHTRAIFADWGIRGGGVVGFVFMQSPKPGTVARTDRPVALRACALRDSKRTFDLRLKATRAAKPDPPPESDPLPVRRDPPLPPPREGPLPDDAPPSAGVPVPGPASSGDLPPPQDLPPSSEYAKGSPEAPREAPVGNHNVVPTLLGLSLPDAEQLCTESGMRLHVDRVPGHPIGRVLEQAPSAGGRRPAGGVVRVVVTAGGDFESDQAPIAPEVYLAKIVVPDLLDRTRLQAARIIEDLGLRVQEEKAKRGLAGRVVDQMPPAGGRVSRGGFVRIWIGPPDPKAALPPKPEPSASAPGMPAPTVPAPEGPGVETPEREVPAPKPPLAPGPLPAGVPDPLSPGHGTVLPKDESVPIGFTWRGVKGAEAYILEIEEEAAEGRWMANARKPSRKTAVILDVERLNSRSSGRLRWRVTAVSNGRQGTPSKWVILK